MSSNNIDYPQKTINISLNVIKCLAILAIICIHTGVYGQGPHGRMIVSAAKFAVPVFFLISGYYSFYESREYSEHKYKNRMIKLLKLVIIANALFFIYNFLTFGNPMDAIPAVDLNSLINYFIFNLSPFAGHLWFLQALLYCYIVYYLLNKNNFDLRKLYYLIPVLLIGNLILGEISSFIGISIPAIYYRNFIFMGLPFFIIGYLVHDKENEITRLISDKFLILAILAMILFSMIEPILLGIKCDLYLGSILLATLIFIWCVKNPQKLNLKIAAWIGGTLYTSMYILHLLAYYIFENHLHFGLFDPIIIFIFTALLSSVSFLR